MSASQPLSLVLGPYTHVAGIADGSIAVEGVTFEPVDVPSLQEAFKRMCREVCFDVCEMSITGYLLALRYGLPFTALPVFPVRGFPQSHTSIVVNGDVSSPRDLEGRRVGARAYTGTASLWVRGMLQDEYGVHLEKVAWVSMEEEHVPQYQQDAPDNVSYELGGDLPALMVAGNIAAAIGVPAGEGARQLIPDARNAARAFHQRSGVYQINHTIVIRNEVLEQHPGLARAIYGAFVQAKQHWLAGTPEVSTAGELGLPNGDPFPYGVEENAASIDALLRYAQTQSLTIGRLMTETTFPPMQV